MNINFKDWLIAEEDTLITLGQKRDSEVSGFCLHNPEINLFAKSNSTNMFIVFAFVFYTIQKEWQIVRQTFPEFLKWIFEDAVRTDNWNYRLQPFHRYANMIGANKKRPNQAAYIASLWKNKNSIFSNVMRLMKGETTSLSTSSEFEIWKYIYQNVDGLGITKAAFATQLIVGKFGCIDSVNTRAYDTMLRADIEAKGKKSGFTLQKRKKNKKVVLDKEGNPILDVVAKDSNVGMRGYAAFLDTLQDLYGDDISKVLWNDWCQIVGNKIVKSGSGDEIVLSVNNQEFKINPYRPKKNLLKMIGKEKEHMGIIDPTTIGTGVSLGHLTAITQSGDWRTPQIKAMEHSYADAANHMFSDVDSLHDVIGDMLSNLQISNVYDLATKNPTISKTIKGADFLFGYSKMIELTGKKIAAALAIYEILKGIGTGNRDKFTLESLNKILGTMLGMAKHTIKNPILGPAVAGLTAYGAGFTDFLEIAGKFKFVSLVYFYFSQVVDLLVKSDAGQKMAEELKNKAKNILGIS